MTLILTYEASPLFEIQARQALPSYSKAGDMLQVLHNGRHPSASQ